MIVVDVFTGPSIPPFVGEKTFLRDIKKALAPGGSVFINYLREFEYEKLSDLLLTKLRRIFLKVKDTEIYCNRFFSCV